MEKFIINDNQKLLKALSCHFPSISARTLRMLVGQKNAKVNGLRVNENVDLIKGDVVEIFIPQKYLQVKLDTVFEDKNIVLLNKPANIEVVSPDESTLTLTKVLKEKFGEIYPVHRLDTNTTGLVLFAKSKKICDLLVKAFKLGFVSKNYFAVVYAQKILPSNQFSDFILDTNQNFVKVGSKKGEGWLSAKLDYEVIKSCEPLYMLDITLHTGRTHQIRAQLSFHNIFVLGDGKYGDKQANRIYHARTQKLCAYKLSFSFPKSSKLSYLNNMAFSISAPFDI